MLKTYAFCCCALLLAGCAAPAPRPWPAATRVGQWRQDLRYLAENLPRLHLDAFHNVSPAEFRAAVDRLDARLGEMLDHQIMIELAAIVALLGDSHTRLEIWERPELHWHPLFFQRFADGTYVTAAAEPHRAALGLQLTRVAGRPLAEAHARLAGLIAHENGAKLAVSLPTVLRCGEALHAVGLAPAPDHVQYAFAGEVEPLVIEVEAAPADARINWVALAAPPESQPLYLRNRERKYWHTWLEESQTLYCAYNDCAEDADQPFADFARRVLAELDERGPERFVLDLRHNGGGNSGVLAPLVEGLRRRPAINQRGRLFAIIGNRTSSAAALNALQLRWYTQALLVGESTGQKPNSFGEMRSFELPNSGLKVTYSTRYFHVVDGDPPSLTPDIPAGLTFYDYLSGRDPCMEAVLGWRGEDASPGQSGALRN